jgi:hypothetical protein
VAVWLYGAFAKRSRIRARCEGLGVELVLTSTTSIETATAISI